MLRYFVLVLVLILTCNSGIAIAQHDESYASSAKMLSCEYGSVSAIPVPTPSDFEEWFAVAVIQIRSEHVLRNATVSVFELTGPHDSAVSMRRVVNVQQFSKPVPEVYYGILDTVAGGQPWSGLIPAKSILLRVRVSLSRDPSAVGAPEDCVVIIGPYHLRRHLDGSWPTG